MARFWMKFWSFSFTSLTWESDMVKGTWSGDSAKDVELLTMRVAKEIKLF